MEKNKSMACVNFLQWALPQLNKRWAGYKKVHRQVCKRIKQRMAELKLSDYKDYQFYLVEYREEWSVLDDMTRITISLFFRDKMQWQMLQHKYITGINLQKRDKDKFSVWSAGCASGEEPYSFAILWQQCFAYKNYVPELEIFATDADRHMLQRAENAFYSRGSLKEIAREWKEQSFYKSSDGYQLKQHLKNMVDFQQQDIREQMPDGPFDIIFCKNLVDMYFEKSLSTRLFRSINARLNQGGLILLGNHEYLDLEAIPGLKLKDKGLNIYYKSK